MIERALQTSPRSCIVTLVQQRPAMEQVSFRSAEEGFVVGGDLQQPRDSSFTRVTSRRSIDEPEATRWCKVRRRSRSSEL